MAYHQPLRAVNSTIAQSSLQLVATDGSLLIQTCKNLKPKTDNRKTTPNFFFFFFAAMHELLADSLLS